MIDHFPSVWQRRGGGFFPLAGVADLLPAARIEQLHPGARGEEQPLIRVVNGQFTDVTRPVARGTVADKPRFAGSRIGGR